MNARLDIAFFGSSLVSAYWNGAATYYRGIIRALAERGHRITFYEPDAYERQQHRDIDDPSWATVVVYQPTEESVWQALQKASRADLLIKTSGVGVLDELLESAVLQVKSAHTMTAFWDVDAPATLDRVQGNRGDAFGALIPKFDLILTYGGGPPVVAAYTELGARRCVPIYNALDPRTHYPVPAKDAYAADLSLLANRLPDREARIEQFFLQASEQVPEKRFLLGGSGWESKNLPANVTNVGHVFTQDHNAFNCSTGVVLNISRESMARYGFSPATRIFEAAGASACIITDEWRGIELFLEPRREVLVAENGADVADYVRTLNPNDAKRIGAAAYRRVIAEHTYERRVDQLEDVLGLEHSPASTAANATPTAACTVAHE